MIRKEVFVIIIFVLLCIVAQSNTGPKKECYYGKCSYFGTSHLIPFSKSYHDSQAQYWCQSPGWKTLISNSYVSLYVLIGAAPYSIIDYLLIFGGVSPCLIIGSETNPPVCVSPAPITSVTLPSGAAWTHFHNIECMTVHIEKPSSYYHIYFYQSYPLINLSSGLCRKWNCEKEPKCVNPLAVIPEVCNIFIDVAQKLAMGNIEPNVIDMATASCINDMHTTFDTTVALAALTLVLDESAKALFDAADIKTTFRNVHTLKHNAISNATRQANDLIKNTGKLCNERKQCLKPINSIKY
ncbi:unnamed protein product [Rotaria socialis]|uniref:Uncharacterized protein n=1 Tax=Rotaria socialis TaxID=392032 RepID=A0A818D7T6_9BILA|nr:unnamed protein product [Rotaria socialis]